MELQDSYKSILEAFTHAGAANEVKVEVKSIHSEHITAKNVSERKTHSGQTAKVPKGPRKRKQHRKAGQRCPKQVVNRVTKKFRLPI